MPVTQKKKSRRASKANVRGGPRMFPITEEMRHWCAMLESELKSWPGVVPKRLFSFRSFYRRKRIFAALPQARSFHSPTAIIFKFDPMPARLLEKAREDSRFISGIQLPGRGWFSFELRCDDDLREALVWLNHAYECAG